MHTLGLSPLLRRILPAILFFVLIFRTSLCACMSDTSIDLVPVSNVKRAEPTGRAALMTAPPPYTAQPESDEYESLLELHERQQVHAAVQPIPTPNAHIDVEAARPASEMAAPPAPAPTPPPLTVEQLRALRAVSTHPDAGNLHETAPKTLASVNLFVGMTRLLVVPLLFFISGFSSQFAMKARDGTPVHFVIRKTWKTALTVALFQGAAHLSRRIHPLPLSEAGATVPYYATREGTDALLNGPTAYVLAILTFDYIYAISRVIVLVFYGDTESTHFINTAKRYKIMKYTLFLSIEVYVMTFSMVVSRLPHLLSPSITRWMYALNSAELHFPLLYICAYFAGLKFIWYYKVLLAAIPRGRHPGRGLSAGVALFVRVSISFLGLYLMHHNYPRSMPAFLDVRTKPALSLVPPGVREVPEQGINLLYGVWVGYSLLVVPEALITAFWSIRALAFPWGKFARHAHIQVYGQVIFVIGNRVFLYDNIFVRWAYLSVTTMVCAHCLGTGGVIVGGWMKRGWNALRGCRTSADAAEPVEGVISL
ncbi:hypothetical protein BJ912DRAFT_1078171 [Pholiota molesta]|nr:hypothetical protein BJ912DRAFT_1078171 [Pholiota molesta]